MIKRLPDEFHKQLKGHCDQEGLFKEVTCHKVYEYTPGMISAVLFRGQTIEGENFHIRLRLSGIAGKTFQFQDLRDAKRMNFIDSLTKEAAAKRVSTRRNAQVEPEVFKSNKQRETARRMSSIRAPVPPSPSSSSHKNMARELIELGKMYKDGLLTTEEFNKAKADLIL